MKTMPTLSTLARVLPLCCGVLLMAAEDDCTIRVIVEDEDECEDVEDVCPLDCPLATNDDGCPICECAGSEGEGEGEGECVTDADCREGQICAYDGACPPCADGDPACAIGCDAANGHCVDVGPDPCLAAFCAPDTICVVDAAGNAQCVPVNGGCRADSDCGRNAFCDFSQCGTRPDGTEPGPGGPNDPVAPCETGVCVEVPPLPTCAEVRCEPGTRCVDTLNGPTCVADGGECQVNDDCGAGAHCEVVCGTDPNCPECDVCVFIGICVADDCPALCGPGSQCVVLADGTVGCEPVEPPPPECMTDDDCQAGTVCNASDACLADPVCSRDANGLIACPEVCWGYCVPPAPTSCSDDTQCAADEFCELRNTCLPCSDPNNDPACLAPCILEGACVPR